MSARLHQNGDLRRLPAAKSVRESGELWRIETKNEMNQMNCKADRLSVKLKTNRRILFSMHPMQHILLMRNSDTSHRLCFLEYREGDPFRTSFHLRGLIPLPTIEVVQISSSIYRPQGAKPL